MQAGSLQGVQRHATMRSRAQHNAARNNAGALWTPPLRSLVPRGVTRMDSSHPRTHQHGHAGAVAHALELSDDLRESGRGEGVQMEAIGQGHHGGEGSREGQRGGRLCGECCMTTVGCTWQPGGHALHASGSVAGAPSVRAAPPAARPCYAPCTSPCKALASHEPMPAPRVGRTCAIWEWVRVA
jgi:hypothetical protein